MVSIVNAGRIRGGQGRVCREIDLTQNEKDFFFCYFFGKRKEFLSKKKLVSGSTIPNKLSQKKFSKTGFPSGKFFFFLFFNQKSAYIALYRNVCCLNTKTKNRSRRKKKKGDPLWRNFLTKVRLE